MGRIARAGLSALVLAALVAGCGSDDGEKAKGRDRAAEKPRRGYGLDPTSRSRYCFEDNGRPVTAPQKVSCARLSLKGKDFSNLNLSGGNFYLADMEGADFRGAKLVGARLEGAKLWNTKMQRADLTGANLARARMIGTQFQDANLRNANLRFTNMRWPNFEGADMTGSWISHSFVIAATFKGAKGGNWGSNEICDITLPSGEKNYSEGCEN